jgi:hypothetical protein
MGQLKVAVAGVSLQTVHSLFGSLKQQVSLQEDSENQS